MGWKGWIGCPGIAPGIAGIPVKNCWFYKYLLIGWLTRHAYKQLSYSGESLHWQPRYQNPPKEMIFPIESLTRHPRTPHWDRPRWQLALTPHHLDLLIIFVDLLIVDMLIYWHVDMIILTLTTHDRDLLGHHDHDYQHILEKPRFVWFAWLSW